MRKFLLVAGIALLYSVPSFGQTTLRKDCTRDRCVYYDHGNRVFSVRTEDTGRLVVEDWPSRRTIAKVTKKNGTITVKKYRR